jgi:hypothetical protein
VVRDRRHLNHVMIGEQNPRGVLSGVAHDQLNRTVRELVDALAIGCVLHNRTSDLQHLELLTNYALYMRLVDSGRLSTETLPRQYVTRAAPSSTISTYERVLFCEGVPVYAVCLLFAVPSAAALRHLFEPPLLYRVLRIVFIGSGEHVGRIYTTRIVAMMAGYFPLRKGLASFEAPCHLSCRLFLAIHKEEPIAFTSFGS